MAKNLWLMKFDPFGTYIARRPISGGEYAFQAGEIIPAGTFPDRRMRQLYDNRVIINIKAQHDFTVIGELPVEVVGETLPVVNVIATPAAVVLPVVDETPAAVVLPGISLPPVIETPVAVVETDVVTEREKLLKDAAELNIKVDGRWSDVRLKAEIDKALNS